ncbi:hypothetical protein BCR41DRAFT_391332 [Lobosporangium transversale]|uniref:GST N-terminal domain-containing protein n=1 Tax=Lobosporangium transversale TaxID=64571 RepID=A0A1Y2H2Y5_9FUNG|nr:hypothetical protein BCR41DRAFT_391332 [Lobosporangium transversale]ORZ28917.1 hypothetical protein BCR41DRAFT_391332 [Lobosporangium transversale]|eukprot:XP_021886590.1 hypothetical protein BCR41DRAFT_391332 [Lobosporangium transversale]
MPVLNIIAPDGKENFIAESIVIDHYLAKKFGLLGDNEWEEFTIKSLYNNIHYLHIHLANVIDHFSHLPVAKGIMAQFQNSELLWRVKESVERGPNIAAWRATDEFKTFAQGSIDIYARSAPPIEEDATTKEA